MLSVLPGTWKEEDGTLYTYLPDGTESVTWTEKGLLSDTVINVTLKWQVIDGHLYETVTGSNAPNRAPVGMSISSEIHILNSQEFVFKDGIQNKEKRLVRTSNR